MNYAIYIEKQEGGFNNHAELLMYVDQAIYDNSEALRAEIQRVANEEGLPVVTELERDDDETADAVADFASIWGTEPIFLRTDEDARKWIEVARLTAPV